MRKRKKEKKRKEKKKKKRERVKRVKMDSINPLKRSAEGAFPLDNKENDADMSNKKSSTNMFLSTSLPTVITTPSKSAVQESSSSSLSVQISNDNNSEDDIINWNYE